MTEPTDSTPAGDQPTSGTSGERAPSDVTRPIPHEQTATIPSGYTYPAPPAQGSRAPGTTEGSEGNEGNEGTESNEGVPLTDEPATRGPRRTGLIIGTVAAVAALGAGGVLVYNALSGSGAQPAEVLPSDAYSYMRIDIDPSAGQKIAAVRFLNKIPQIKGFESGDPRKQLWELATKDAGSDCVSKFAYDTDIAPWLGDRAGAALRPGGTPDDPNFALALQVTDETEAKETLTRLFACEDGEQPDVRTRDGYALITLAGKGDDLVAAVDKGTLAGSATFTADMAALGEEGVVSFWGDLQPMLKDAANMAPDAAAQAGVTDDIKGSFAAALRFDPSFVELAGIGRGMRAATGAKPVQDDSRALGQLPDDTMAALHMSGAARNLDSDWPRLKKQLDDAAAAEGQEDMVALLEDELGITLPDDLKAILGSSFTLALPEQDFESDPVVGARVISKEAARAEEVLTKIEDVAGSSLLTKRLEGDRLVFATSPEYADRLKAGGKLGDSEPFKTALGDLSTSSGAIFVDLDKLEKLYLADADGDAKAAIEALRAVGMKATVTEDNEMTFSLRVVGN